VNLDASPRSSGRHYFNHSSLMHIGDNDDVYFEDEEVTPIEEEEKQPDLRLDCPQIDLEEANGIIKKDIVHK